MKLLLSAVMVIGFFMIAAFAPQDKPEQKRESHFTPQEDSLRMVRMNAEVKENLESVNKIIAGQEDKPASQVFKNLQMFKELKAAQVPGIMGFWSRSLGTACQHCHVVDEWAKDDKPEKQIARDMVSMVGEINSKLLANIKNLDSKNPRISCWTCHQGRIKPPAPPWFRNMKRQEDQR